MNPSPLKISRRNILTAAAILLVTVIAYLPALRAGYIWDDDAYVTENAHLESLDGLRQIWFKIGATDQYYPLVFTTFWIERRLWGLAPLGYHLVNVLLHATAAILVWIILKKLNVRGATFAATIFAIHPVHVESVAWVTERKNVLSGVFYLSSLLAYLRFVGLSNIEPACRSWRWYAVAVALYCCALLSKTVTLTLPVVLVIFLWWKQSRLTWRGVLWIVPFLVIGAGAGAVTVWLERHHVGTEYVNWGLSFTDRILIAGRAFWFYLSKLAWPANLAFIYARWRIPGAPAWHFVAPMSAIALLVIAWTARNRFGKGPLAALAFFVVTLSPALGFVDVYPMRFSFVADHFQYLASLGPLALLAAAAARAPIPRTLTRTGGVVLLIVSATLTWRQCGIYRDAETLWNDTIHKDPGSWMAHGNLAAVLARDGRIDEAIDHYRTGLRLNDDAPQVHFNLAVLLQGNGDRDEAIAHYERAVEILPRYAEAHNNLGVCLAEIGQTDQAVEHYEKALEGKPDYADAHGNLANLLIQRGRIEEAIEHYRQAVASATDPTIFHFNMAAALMKMGLHNEAESHYRSAQQGFEAILRSHPDDARAQVGLARTRSALQELKRP